MRLRGNKAAAAWCNDAPDTLVCNVKKPLSFLNNNMTDWMNNHIDRMSGMSYTQNGAGDTAVLVHGALADERMWQPHQALLAQRWRAVAVTLRYHFGSADSHLSPVRAAPAPFGISTHAEDLATFIEGMERGPVHLVAWSYSAHAALYLACHRPQLLRSVFVYEPGFPTYVTDPEALAAFEADAARMYGPLGAAVHSGDLERAVELLMDASGQRPGYFRDQPTHRQQIQRDNAHTLPLLMTQAPPPAVTAEQLRSVQVPVCVARGAQTRPVFGVVARAAAQALPGVQHLVVENAHHMWPDEQPAAFCDALESFWSAAASRPHADVR